MNFKQYMAYIVLLLWLTTLIEGITAQCARCEYFDVVVEMCSSCNIICPRQKRTCLRLCPEWPQCLQSNPETTTLSVTPVTQGMPVISSPVWLWIIGSVAVAVLLILIVGGAVWYIRSRSCFWQQQKAEVSTVAYSEVPTGGVPPENGAHSGPDTRQNPLAISGNNEDCVVDCDTTRASRSRS